MAKDNPEKTLPVAPEAPADERARAEDARLEEAGSERQSAEGAHQDMAGVDRPRVPKSDAAFRTISEVAEELDVPQHVLRFWETKFTTIRPLKRGGGRRYYRPEDVTLLKRILALLYTDGMTIRGVQKLLRDNSGKPHGGDEAQVEAAPAPAFSGVERADAERLLTELTILRDDLRAALAAA